MPTTPQIVAHRGYSSRFRENSPAAWVGAMDAGADVIEVDLRVTADGLPVCSHDEDLKRIAGQDMLIAETTSERLASIEADGYPAAPGLDLLFQTVPAHQPILFDIKDERDTALDLFLDRLQATGRENLILGLHALSSVRHVRDKGWNGQILGLVRPTTAPDDFFAAGGDILRLWEADADDAAIQRQVAAGRPVWITTGEHTTGRLVGDHDDAALRRMATAGATGFLVNDPVTARAALSEASAKS